MLLIHMRILFLTPQFPHPARSGGTIKTASVLSYLARRHHLDIVCFAPSEWSEEQSAWAARMGEVTTVPMRRDRSALNLVRSYVAGVPLSVYRNRSAELAALTLERPHRGEHGAVFVDGWLMAQYVPRGFRGKRVLHQHNAEYVMWQRQAAYETNPVRRAVVRREAARVRRYEASILDRFDVVLAVSDADRRALRAAGSESVPIELLPNLPDPALLDRPAGPGESTEQVVIYLATLSWPPNAQGLLRFVRDTFPLLRSRLPNVRLVVAGTGASPALRTMARGVPGVELVGAVDDPETLYAKARAFVEVALGGSGTRVKVLNALARGIPVVTTPDGAEGLAIRPGRDALVSATPGAMADALARLMTDDETWKELSRNGRALVRKRYVADAAYPILDRIFEAGDG